MVARLAQGTRNARGTLVQMCATSSSMGRGGAVEAFLSRVGPTLRGGTASTMDRGEIEQLICCLESTMADEDIDWGRLHGTWDVCFTTARDVRGLMNERPLPFAQANLVGQVYDEAGGVENFIVLTAVRDTSWPLISDFLNGTSIRVGVQAEWQVTGMRSIGLRFKRASLGQIEFTDEAALKSLLINPIFPPRGQWNLDALGFLRDAKLTLDFLSGAEAAGDGGEDSRSSGRRGRSITPSLHIAYLDDDLLVGRAIETGGLYVYRRRQT